nr:immunoglobulin light chain junction region [Macaca mulatta]
YMQGLEFPYSF